MMFLHYVSQMHSLLIWIQSKPAEMGFISRIQIKGQTGNELPAAQVLFFANRFCIFCLENHWRVYMVPPTCCDADTPYRSSVAKCSQFLLMLWYVISLPAQLLASVTMTSAGRGPWVESRLLLICHWSFPTTTLRLSSLTSPLWVMTVMLLKPANTWRINWDQK